MKKTIVVFVLLGICFAAAAQSRDFQITGRTLVKYRGTAAEVRIPAGVTSIGDYAFYDCSGLTSVTLPEGVTSIGKGAFSGCSGLTSVTLPASVTSIEERAFEGCSGLTSITLPAGLTIIGIGAFAKCESLTSVTLPEGLTEIWNNTFEGCGNLEPPAIPAGVAVYGRAGQDAAGTWVDEGGRAVVIINNRKELYIAANFVRWGRSGPGWKPEVVNGFYQLSIDDGIAWVGNGNVHGGCSISVFYSVSGDGTLLTVRVKNDWWERDVASYEDTRTFRLRRVYQ
ncbi:MAG: leucine-rich repeat domain-containing protein [Treponema sp.]|jgi:hypothetical protein|nr:leucine-rich repeat domain-containing protein [Treponema sp.]